MGELNQDQETEAGLEFTAGRAALLRHYVSQGEAIENLRFATVWQPNRVVWMYNMFIRFPRKDTEDHLVIVKGVSEEGPVIAFHGGSGLVAALLSFGDRYRRGKLNWRPDEEPPQSYVEYEVHIRGRVAYLDEHGIHQ